MRLKRKFVALIVVVMLVVTALFASMMSQYAQGGRIAYVGVKTDKGTFADGENVSFKFIPLTNGVYFSTSGIDTSYGMYYGQTIGAVHIIRIPADVDPDHIINDKKILSKVQSWDNRDMTVAFDYFNSTDGTMSLSWNGTVMQYLYGDSYASPSVIYRKALAGYYLIYPQFTSLDGHSVKFQLDRNAIFYLDTLKLSAVPGIYGTIVTYNMTVSVPTTLTGGSHCNMSWSINGMGGREENGSDSNRVEFDIVPGESHTFTIEEQAYFYSGMQSFHLTGWIDTTWGNYTFDKTDWLIDGRWYDTPEYYYY
jgi:hypothetical protein